MQIALFERQHQYAEYVTRLLRAIESISQATVVYYAEPDYIISDVSHRLESFEIAILCQQPDTHDEIYIGKAIMQFNAFCQIIFISKTGLLNPEYYEIPHLYTLGVNQVPQYMNMVIRRAIGNLEKEDRDQFLVVTNFEKRFVPCRDVLYLEHVLRKTSIATGHNAMETYQSPQELLQFDQRGRFVQCHRGFFVNTQKIVGLRSSELLLAGGRTIPIGRTFQKEIKAVFLKSANTHQCT